MPSPRAVPSRAEAAKGASGGLAIRGRRQDSLCRLRKRDHPDAVLLRQVREKRADDLLRDCKPARRHVLRRHRARGVDRQHDRGLLLLDREHRMRAREPGCEERESEEREGRRQVTEPARASADEIGHEGRARECRRLPVPATLEQDVAGDRSRHGEERQERERPGEAHRLPPLRRRCIASGRSQSPSVERTT